MQYLHQLYKIEAKKNNLLNLIIKVPGIFRAGGGLYALKFNCDEKFQERKDGKKNGGFTHLPIHLQL